MNREGAQSLEERLGYNRTEHFAEVRARFLSNPLTGLAFRDETERHVAADCYAEGYIAALETALKAILDV